jgi:phage/plasmid-like protein (TIGR03299 family)
MHALEIDREGRASFCYNQKNGNPWHMLGAPFESGFTLEQGLEAARVRKAEKTTLYALTPFGMQEVESHNAIIWPSVDEPDRYDVIGVNSQSYHLVQYSEVAEIAMAIVGASSGEAVLDTMGLLHSGKKFFGFIDFGDMDLELPNGAVDKLVRGLGFVSSHDSTQAITFYTTMVRAVCQNTVTAGLSSAKNKMSIRHTASADARLYQARSLLGLAYGADTTFTEIVSKLSAMSATHDTLQRVIKLIWPLEDDAPDRAKTIWNNRANKIHKLWYAPSNAGGFGENRWVVYNTIGEYLDHAYGSDPIKRATNSIDPTSSVTNKKLMMLDYLVGSSN